jgi:hypothetical protein
MVTFRQHGTTRLLEPTEASILRGANRSALGLRSVREPGHPSNLHDEATGARRTDLQQAAEDGDLAAMYQFALVCGEPGLRRYWLRKAARGGVVSALYA